MKQTLLSFFSLVILSFFSACGEYGVEESTTQARSVNITIAGYAADGYISGANVCLDVDLSGGCSIDERVVTTSEHGGFSFGTYAKNVGSLVSVVVSDGIDTATQKNFIGKLRSIDVVEENNNYFHATPLTDLIATSFLNSSTLNSTTLLEARNLIATAYGIHTSYVEKNPTSYGGVFAKTQEIQQTKTMFEVSATKAMGISLTTSQRTKLQEDIKQAIVGQIKEDTVIDIQKALIKLEEIAKITMPENEKTFIKEQIANIKVDIESFVSHKDLNLTNLNTYQVALEAKGDEAYTILKNATASDALESFALNIDIFAVVSPDDNTTLPPDDNATIPTEVSVSFSGVLVDGYIREATLCLDFDYDGLCSASEPITRTTNSGFFNFTNVTVQKNTLFPIVAYGGTDSFTSSTYDAQLKTIISTNDIAPTTTTVISPLTDMLTVDFIAKEVKNKTTLDASSAALATAFGISTQQLYSDPAQSVSLFMLSQELEHIKKLCEVVVKKTTGNAYDDAQLLSLRDAIKSAIAQQVVVSTYENLDMYRVLTVLEVNLDISILNADEEFVDAQVKEIKRVSAELAKSPDIATFTLPRIQVKLAEEMAVAYASVTFVPLTLSVESMIKSMYDKESAIYDIDACIYNETYTNFLSNDVNVTESRSEDASNGLSIKSNLGEHILYYPNLTQTKTNTEVTIFETANLFNFAYDTAWVDVNNTKIIYIQTPQDADSGLYGCMRAKLNATQAGNIVLEKVYRYTE